MSKGMAPVAVAEYKDFEIVITADGEKYFAQVIRSPVGESNRCSINLPFDQNQILLRLENAILRSVKPVRSSRLEADLRQIGDALFRSLLIQTDDIRLLYSGSRQALGHARLRVKLRIEAEALGALPWEYFYDDLVVKDYLGLDAQTSLVRYVNMAQPVPQMAIQGPLRILGMAANPRNGTGYAALDVTDERRKVDKAIHSLHERGEIDFQWVLGESHSDLFEAMYKGPWHVFHFVGHGGVDAQGEGYIVLANETGNAEEYSATKLTRMLRLESSLRLVVLNCCDSARGSSSLAKRLVLSGIPAVIAMQFPISDQAAVELSSAFYSALANGEPVDGAVTHARIRIQNRSNIEWGIPVLYMRTPDGRIFEKRLTQGAPSSSPPPLAAAAAPAPVLDAAAPLQDQPLPVAKPLGTSFSDLAVAAEQLDVQPISELFTDAPLQPLSRDQLITLLETGKQLLEQQPGNDALRRRLAKVYFEIGRRYQAENSMNKAFVNISSAIDLDQTEPEYLYSRANTYARIEQFEAAAADMDRAIALAPERGELHWAKGVICLLASRNAVQQDQLRTAVESFSQAIRCDATVAKYYSSRGAALSRCGRAADALADLSVAIRLNPNDAKSYFNRAQLRLRQLDRTGALEDLQTAAQLGHAAASAEIQRLSVGGERLH
jgi:tetratricopeptide (TPR) repeat protein/CHAT domain-containing protein